MSGLSGLWSPQSLEKVGHLDDWSELDFDLGFLLSNLFKSVHDVTKRVNILGWFLDLEFDLLYVIGKML